MENIGIFELIVIASAVATPIYFGIQAHHHNKWVRISTELGDGVWTYKFKRGDEIVTVTYTSKDKCWRIKSIGLRTTSYLEYASPEDALKAHLEKN